MADFNSILESPAFRAMLMESTLAMLNDYRLRLIDLLPSKDAKVNHDPGDEDRG